jgi:hypothetical protein
MPKPTWHQLTQALKTGEPLTMTGPDGAKHTGRVIGIMADDGKNAWLIKIHSAKRDGDCGVCNTVCVTTVD